MKIIEKQVEFPGRKRIKKISEESNGDIIVDITKAEGTVTVEGTQVNASTLEKINWRDDDSVSFASMQGDVLPEALAEKVQIVTKSNGETWLIPPLNQGQSIQLGKVTGTTLKNENNIEMANAQIGTDFPSNAQLSVVNTNLNLSINTNSTNLSNHNNDGVKHITSPERNAWNAKQNEIIGAASSITNTNLNPNKILLSDASGKVVTGNLSGYDLERCNQLLIGATSSLQAQLDLKADISLSNSPLVQKNGTTGVDFVTNYGTGSLNTGSNQAKAGTWYRLWKSGWLEQGGYWQRSSVVGDISGINVNFLKAFADDTYYCNATPYRNDGSSPNRDFRGQIYRKNSSEINMGWYGNNALGITWYACGMKGDR